MSDGRATILVVDDDPAIRKQLAWALENDYRVLEAASEPDALDLLGREAVDLVLLDLHLPPRVEGIEGGLAVLESVRASDAALPAIVLTADQDRRTALSVVERGAYDFFEKPVSLAELMVLVRRALRLRRAECEVARLRNELLDMGTFDELVGTSSAIRAVIDVVRKVADTRATVLITGESGTGKELVARALHRRSSRRDRRFVALNCSALPDTLIEEELFGHERGAFTGAIARRPGRFEIADGGTLFLDEIGDLSPAAQAKVLRVLQEGEFDRIGSRAAVRVDVRVVAATRVDLRSQVRAGLFREDLYYRLQVVECEVPPLRARLEDVPLLIAHFLRKHDGTGRRFSREATSRLLQYDWPGNVRELEHAVERALLLSASSVIGPDALPPALADGAASPGAVPQWELPPGGVSLREVEKNLVAQALARAEGNQVRAARLLSITRAMLIQRMKRYGLGGSGSRGAEG
jgi:DNA-binding NtrC family response regulator